MKHRVRATRTHGWWAIESLDDDRIMSQARRLDQVPRMVAQALELWYADEPHPDGTPRTFSPSDIEVAEVILDDDLGSLIDQARRQRADADRLAARATESAREAARAAAGAGLTTRDIGELLGVSHQRAAQILQVAQRRR